MSVNEKLDEAKFFLEMFHTLEKRESLTYDFKIQEEASFLLSAILNSFYSVTEIAKDDGIRRTDVDNFKNSHPLFYSGSGIRWVKKHYSSCKTYKSRPFGLYSTKG